jgi:hypothetical protein
LPSADNELRDKHLKNLAAEIERLEHAVAALG